MKSTKSAKPRKVKVSFDAQLSRKEIAMMKEAVEDSYYASYGDYRQALLRLANILAASGNLEPFVPDDED
ncbi:MAG: hypothetical protein AB7J46_06680 [Candidatus Altimarinota bacterium]